MLNLRSLPPATLRAWRAPLSITMCSVPGQDATGHIPPAPPRHPRPLSDADAERVRAQPRAARAEAEVRRRPARGRGAHRLAPGLRAVLALAGRARPRAQRFLPRPSRPGGVIAPRPAQLVAGAGDFARSSHTPLLATVDPEAEPIAR